MDTEVKEEEVKEEVLNLDDVELSIENDEPAEDSWIALAKEQGLEIAEDSFEAVKEALTKPLMEKLAEVDGKKMEDYFGDLSPKTRMEIELQKTGMTLDEINAPLENIKTYKAMSDVELYREDLVLRYPNASQEFIDADVEKAVESGQVSHDATRLRLDLDNMESSINAERQTIIDKYKVESIRQAETKRVNEIESISKALNEVPSFMGSVIAAESKAAMAKRYGDGKYDQILKDPDFIAKALMYHELGQKAYEAAIAKSEAKGKLAITKNLHNTPPLDNVGAGKSITPQEQLTGLAKLRNEPGLK